MKLDGVKVLDLSAFLPGPHMTMLMADHGANVVMVEPDNGIGEPTRELGERTKDGVSVWFRNIARGKRSYKVNLKDPIQHAEFMSLAAQADVVVEAFRPGVVKRLGVDYEAVKAINPGIVYCSISAFGQEGAYAQKPAHDLVLQAMGGTIDLCRGNDDQPAMPPIPSADAHASLLALSGILMALLRRQTTGEGDYIDMSMYDALLSWTPNVTGPVFAEGKHPDPKSMRSFGGGAMNRIYKTSDGQHLVIGGSEIKFANNLLTALGRSDLLPLAKLPPGPEQNDLHDFFEAIFAAKPLAHWVSFLADVDCCWSEIRSLKDSFEDEHTKTRGMRITDLAGNSHIGNPIKFAFEPARPQLDVPTFGEHTDTLKKGFQCPD